MWYVYVLQSVHPKFAELGKKGPTYVGSTTNPARRLRQHCGELSGGGKYTATLRPWEPRALYGPYKDRSEAFKAEMALKKKNKSTNRIHWKKATSLKRGLGPDDPWVKDPTTFNEELSGEQSFDPNS